MYTYYFFNGGLVGEAIICNPVFRCCGRYVIGIPFMFYWVLYQARNYDVDERWAILRRNKPLRIKVCVWQFCCPAHWSIWATRFSRLLKPCFQIFSPLINFCAYFSSCVTVRHWYQCTCCVFRLYSHDFNFVSRRLTVVTRRSVWGGGTWTDLENTRKLGWGGMGKQALVLVWWYEFSYCVCCKMAVRG